MRVAHLFPCLVLPLQALSLDAVAQPAAPFYRGKTISIYVGSAAGGSYDSYARLIASHLGKHLAGTPTVLVRNMPGAASLEPIHKLIESNESVVIPLRMRDSRGSARCGNPNIVLPRIVAAFDIRAI